MPVFNGELYVEHALRSLLNQTFEDFELIISDNASTDRTSEICLDYASGDPRIHYTRNPTNVGFCRNQNHVIRVAVGEYFLLAHSDDVRSLDYLARTIDILDADGSIVVCYSKTRDIDEYDNPLPREDVELRLDSTDPRERFRDIIRMDHICTPDFGLTRGSVLRTTPLHGDYADSDRVLLAELLFHGRFYCIPDYLFFRRAHPLQSTAIAPDRQSRTVWFNPDNKGKLVFPHFRQFKEYLSMIRRAPIDWQTRAWCSVEMLRWLATNRGRLLNDVDFAFRETFRPLYYLLTSRVHSS
jgi:glycosyltransferase involved in cell wall biosynthesis